MTGADSPTALPTRLGVVLVLGKVDTTALEFLLLRLNQELRQFEFELLEPQRDHALLRLLKQKRAVHAEIQEELDSGAFARRLQRELQARITEYGLRDTPPPNVIVVSLTTVETNYYMLAGIGADPDEPTPVAVIALGNWKRTMAPPSLPEFILALVIAESVRIRMQGTLGSTHLGTKGCLFDFTGNLHHSRYLVLNAFVCHVCRGRLDAREAGLADDLERALSLSWLGSATTPGAPAAVAAGLGVDLFTTKGLEPTRWEQARALLVSEAGRQLVTIGGALLLAALLLLLGLS